MRILAVLLLALLLGGCASTPLLAPERTLFEDHRFGAASARISAADVFALSDEMRAYLGADFARDTLVKGRHRALYDALYVREQLKLDYDATVTRNAAEAFAARSGNCLSLVIMTAAFAKELGLAVRYQTVIGDETWGRSGDIYLAVGHVNLTLGRRTNDSGFAKIESEHMTIDFVPTVDSRIHRARVIREETIVAMYMNNRAVESLAAGQLDDAYWYAREAIRQDPRFLVAYNTLAVVYLRHRDPAQAERVLARVLDVEPANLQAMSNLVPVLSALGREADAQAQARAVARIEPDPPFKYYHLGIAALKDGDYRAARDHFEKEVDRAAYYHEFHFWLAVALVGMGEVKQAREHLNIAIESSTTRYDRDLYAAKLDRIRSYR